MRKKSVFRGMRRGLLAEANKTAAQKTRGFGSDTVIIFACVASAAEAHSLICEVLREAVLHNPPDQLHRQRLIEGELNRPARELVRR